MESKASWLLRGGLGAHAASSPLLRAGCW